MPGEINCPAPCRHAQQVSRAAMAVGDDHGALYHLVPAEVWAALKAAGTPYFPPTYEGDGFIHLTKDPQLLLGVANHFYTDVPGAYVVLVIDSARLTSEVKFEPAAPVGDKPAADTDTLFPHLFGTIDFASVVEEKPVERDGTGKFLSISGV
mmetsp:Transcript_35177/g.111185  ORF Transcript_35177/g.111185 Transcript_35177/m.111185 type:complete len:152 (+) Transcript_35177:180-635(+)